MVGTWSARSGPKPEILNASWGFGAEKSSGLMQGTVYGLGQKDAALGANRAGGLQAIPKNSERSVPWAALSAQVPSSLGEAQTGATSVVWAYFGICFLELKGIYRFLVSQFSAFTKYKQLQTSAVLWLDG